VAEHGGNAAKQAAALANAEAAAAQVTDGLFLDLDTLWIFVQEVNVPRWCVARTESFRTPFLFHRSGPGIERVQGTHGFGQIEG